MEVIMEAGNNGLYKAMKKSANKYSILEDLPEDDPVEIDTLKGRMEKWKEDRVKEADMSNQQTMEDGNLEEDIVKSENELEENVIANEIAGRGSNIL
ncbi:hypothetical protein Tco_0785217 [Tanacetum coccineum]